ncbi:MAG TPA: formyltransferase family protein [Bacteroidia bacterium]|nr:formyltransferase family protein [Bacteroidia bacterium]
MRVVFWCGNEPNQYALAHKLNKSIGLSGIVSETRPAPPAPSAFAVAGKILERIVLPSIGNAWRNMKQFYARQYPAFPEVPVVDVSSINSDTAYTFTTNLQPDLIIVSGTGLVRKRMLSLPVSIGILNLHTGLSPYVKGGPNCTNWCIAEGRPYLIGNTVMWIDEGIDSGNIFTTAFTPFTGHESLNAIHVNVMEHAHSLVLHAVQHIAKGNRQSVPQKQIAEGTTYYTREWNFIKKIKLKRNLRLFRNCFKSNQCESKRKEVAVVTV